MRESARTFPNPPRPHPARVTSRYKFANILICQCFAGESGGPVSMPIPETFGDRSISSLVVVSFTL
jgi:hypothetical protein